MNADLRYHLARVRRHLPLVVLVAGAIIGLAVTVALTLPPVYRAQAVLLVESPQIPGDLATPTVRTSPAEQLQIIEQRMFTRANLLDTARRFNLYEGQTLDPTRIVEDMRARTRLNVSQGANLATVVVISFEAANPSTAAEVANAYVSFMLEENIALRTSIAAQTVDFFRREVQRLNEELESRSGRILAFKLEHRDSLPEDLPTLRERQGALQAQLQELDDAARRITQNRDAFIDRWQRTGRIDVVVEDALAPFLRRLAELQDELERTSAALGSDSQRAVGVRARIAALQRSLDAQLAADGAGGRGLEAVFDHHLASIDAQLGDIADDRDVLETRLGQIGAQVQETLTNAITLDSLEREYASVREQHSRAIASVSAAETGDLIETLARGQRMGVIEQAVPPSRPSKPNRLMIVAFGVLGGLALAATLVMALEKLNQTVRRPSDLGKHLGIAPLATIPWMDTPGVLGLRRASGATLWVAVLGGVPALLYAIHVFHLPLDLVFWQLADRTGLGSFLDQLIRRPGG